MLRGAETDCKPGDHNCTSQSLFSLILSLMSNKNTLLLTRNAIWKTRSLFPNVLIFIKLFMSRPHPCTECEKAFASATELKQHIKVHSGV